VLVELGVMEQRYAAVLEVLRDGASVTEVGRRYGVARQSVHRWLRLYAGRGLAGLVDQPSKPDGCPHQMSPQVEALIVELRGGASAVGSSDVVVPVGGSGCEAVARS